MSEKALNILRVGTHSQEAQEEQRMKLTARRCLAYGGGKPTRILVPDEDEESELERQQNGLRGAVLLEDTNDAFLTCGVDHTMIVWRTFGKELAEMSGHTDQITGVWELQGSRIVSLSIDSSLRVWNARTGEEICSIATTVDSPSKVQFGEKQEFVCLTENNATRLVTLEGRDITTLKNLNTPLQAIFSVGGDKWITVANKTHKLWSRQGTPLYEFATPFSLQDGFLVLAEGGLLVADSAHQILLFDASGKRIAQCEPNAKTANAARSFFRSVYSADQSMNARSTVDDFIHRNSHRSAKFYGSKALEERGMSDRVLEKNRSLWDFFNRPDIRLIKTFLKDEIATARSSETQIGKSIEELNKLVDAESNKRTAFIALAIIGLAAALLYMNTQLGIAIGGAAASVLAAVHALKMHLRLRKRRNSGRVLDALTPRFESFISGVKRFRRDTLSQVPVFKSTAAYSGSQLDRIIQETIEQVIKPVARRECGIIDHDDIISEDRQPLLLRDWAFIQEKSDPVAQKIDAHNELSFWWSNDLGRFVFAVQYLQFIYLGKEKIDVFTTFYDFVKDAFVAKQSHTFYYKDVTNISKRELTRSSSAVGDSRETLEATQIVMAVSSGQQIALTVLNEQSMRTLRIQNTDSDGLSTDERAAKMRRDIEKLRSDDSMDKESRDDEIARLEQWIEVLRAEEVPDDEEFENDDAQENRADQAIAVIRKQISEHKRERPEALTNYGH